MAREITTASCSRKAEGREIAGWRPSEALRRTVAAGDFAIENRQGSDRHRQENEPRLVFARSQDADAQQLKAEERRREIPRGPIEGELEEAEQDENGPRPAPAHRLAAPYLDQCIEHQKRDRDCQKQHDVVKRSLAGK